MGDSVPRSQSWKWQVSVLLLFATAIMYMDRQTLANVAVRITNEFQLSEEQYGHLELAFGWAFAVGALIFGPLVDVVSVRWLYPIALLGWSAAGVFTGIAEGYWQLLVCRIMLGVFEAGHWPCALATIQRLLTRSDRGMGNSVLQSGASVGAILTPIIINTMIGSNHEPGAWRMPFFIIGGIGPFWVIVWLAMIRSRDLAAPASDAPATADAPRAPIWQVWFDRRFAVLLVIVFCINATWQLVRAWLPKYMQQQKGYSEQESLYFVSAYYIATDVGCLLAGAATLWLARRGMEVHRSRMLVFGACAVLTSLTVVAAQLPAGWPLLAVLLVVAAGSLGLFPCYYSFSQELTATHMGKVTGSLAAIGWFLTSPIQPMFGRLKDETGSFDLGFALTGLPPLIAFVTLWLLWPKVEKQTT